MLQKIFLYIIEIEIYGFIGLFLPVLLKDINIWFVLQSAYSYAPYVLTLLLLNFNNEHIDSLF